MYVSENTRYNYANLGVIFFIIIIAIFFFKEIYTIVESLASLKEALNEENQKLLLEIKFLEKQQLVEVENLKKFNSELLLELKENSTLRHEEHKRAMLYNYVCFVGCLTVPFLLGVIFFLSKLVIFTVFNFFFCVMVL